MLDQNIRTYIDVLEFQTARRERIKGEWNGRRRGKQLGHAAGHQEGIQEGRKELVRTLLQRRGAEISGTANECLERADAATLKVWIEQLLANEMPPELKLR